jgi:peptide/nickel transport system substrate-binding protein
MGSGGGSTVRRSRRSALRLMIAGTSAALLAACSAGAPSSQAPIGATAAPTTPPQPTPAPASGATAQPKAVAPGAAQPTVNRLVMGVVPPGRDTQELRHIGQPDTWQLRPMYEYLIGMDPKSGKLISQLATEWTLEPDGTSWRFKLRQGVQFHGGNGEFTAKDVVFSWQDLIQPDSLHGEANYWRTTVKDIEIVNDYEVIFRLAYPEANFLHGLSEAEGGMEMSSKVHFDKIGAPRMDGPAIAGTGPYEFRERAQGQYVRYQRVPYQHWRVTPDFPEFEWRFMRETSSRQAALLAKEIQLTSLPYDLQDAALQRGFKIIKGNIAGLRTRVTLNGVYIEDVDNLTGWVYPDSPLVDVRVRRALNQAIDRDLINSSLLKGKGELQIQQHLHPTRPGWNPEWERRFPELYGYSPDAAKQLLAEAGYGPGGKPFEMTFQVAPLAQYSGAEEIAETVAEFWRKSGVSVKLETQDTVQRAGLARDLKLVNQAAIVATSAAELIGTRAYNSSIQPRGGGVEDPDVDKVLHELGRTMDEAKQAELWRRVGDLMFEKYMDVPLFWLPAEAMVDPTVVADWTYPGSISGTWTHVEYIKAA